MDTSTIVCIEQFLLLTITIILSPILSMSVVTIRIKLKCVGFHMYIESWNMCRVNVTKIKERMLFACDIL